MPLSIWSVKSRTAGGRAKYFAGTEELYIIAGF